jgi:hypothetical protein
MEVGDYWKRHDHTYPRRINGITSLWGRVYYISFENSDIALRYSYIIENYKFYKKSDDKSRRIINTGEEQSTEIPIFYGMPSATSVVLEIIAPFIVTVVVIVSVAGLTVALYDLLMWIKS